MLDNVIENGMLLVGRSFGSEEYRYGFNGKENTDEIYGDDMLVDFGARIYDARLGRWLSMDPYARKYPSFTPYNFTNNSPIVQKDPNGKEITLYYFDKQGKKQSFIFNPNEKYTGNVSQIKMFYDSYEYLKSKGADDVFTDLGNDTENKVDVLITWGQGSTKTDLNEYYVQTDAKDFLGEIVWNPSEGLKFKDVNGEKGKISPITVLGHELQHARNLRSFGFLGMAFRYRLKNIYYENSEENSAVDYENERAGKLNEGIRHHHKGKYTKTISPTSNKTSKDIKKERKKK